MSFWCASSIFTAEIFQHYVFDGKCASAYSGQNRTQVCLVGVADTLFNGKKPEGVVLRNDQLSHCFWNIYHVLNANCLRSQWPDQWPAIVDEWAEPLNEDSPEVAQLRPMLKQTMVCYKLIVMKRLFMLYCIPLCV